MQLARVNSRATVGVSAPEVSVEVHLGGGLPRMSVVGLPETAVREARDRVRAALVNAGFHVPEGLITISLAPAELPKEGGGFDLPIALGILVASQQVSPRRLEQAEFMGELSLGGELRPVRGVLPAAIRAAERARTLVIPEDNQAEAALLQRGCCLRADTLLRVTAWLNGRADLPRVEPRGPEADAETPDLGDVIGQPHARRALEIAAAGGHNLLMIGPPGTGKTMLAARMPGILPPMTEQEALETAAIASISHQPLDPARWRLRPFRAPHHTASGVALVGGGTRPHPGEISLAHNGVLFLDELTEFSRHVLEVLREPLESGRILISRAARQAEFPARFQLVCAMNPCPCGHAGDPRGTCRCSADQVQRYLARVSGPFLDRIDILVEVPRPEFSVLEAGGNRGECSAAVRQRVVAARRLQLQRSACANAHLDPGGIRRHCALDSACKDLLGTACERLLLSPRSCHRVLKVARTIADLDGAASIRAAHLAEAIAYRGSAGGPASMGRP